MTVPAHGDPTDYTDAAPAGAATGPALPVPAAPAAGGDRPDPGQHTADLIAEVDTELERDAGAADDGKKAPADPEREYPDGAIAVALSGPEGRRGVVHVMPSDEWPSSAFSALQPPMPDYEAWAEQCLALDDYDAVWLELNPRLKDVNEMFTEYRRLTGQTEANFPRSRQSLRRMARK